MNVDTLESKTVKNNTINDGEDLKYCSTKKQKLKCPKCECFCKKRITLNKHIDTKHEGT